MVILRTLGGLPKVRSTDTLVVVLTLFGARKVSFAGRPPAVVTRACTAASWTLVTVLIRRGLMEAVKSFFPPAFTAPTGSIRMGATSMSISWQMLARRAAGSVILSCALPLALKMAWLAG